MHAIQTSGNCIRNTTTDPLAGAAHDEIANPLGWCEIIRQWSTRHLLSYLEAILRVYNAAGRRDNIYKARIKILVAPRSWRGGGRMLVLIIGRQAIFTRIGTRAIARQACH